MRIGVGPVLVNWWKTVGGINTAWPVCTWMRSSPRHISPVPSMMKYISSCSWLCHGTWPPFGSSVTWPIAKFLHWIGLPPPTRFCGRLRAGYVLPAICARSAMVMIFLSMAQIGLISDTHGLLRPEVVCALAGSQLIIHAGDVGRPEVLDELRRIAPVVAVRGNVDRGAWAGALPETAVVDPGIYVLHNLHDLKLDAAA